jgi:hypothetical protein
MKKMPTEDTYGKCRGECRDRAREGEEDRQKSIAMPPCGEPSRNSPRGPSVGAISREYGEAEHNPARMPQRFVG